MSDSAPVTSEWSAGFTTTKRTQFQAMGGIVFFATGAAAPAKDMAGNAVPPMMAVEVGIGETVYWRTNADGAIFTTWLELGD